VNIFKILLLPSVGGRDRVGIVTRKNLGHDPSSGRDPKFLPVATRTRVVTQPVATRNFFESCRIELVISFSHDFRVFSLWVTTRLGRDPRKKFGSRPDLGQILYRNFSNHILVRKVFLYDFTINFIYII
jgi:hypothetical protein